MKNKLIILDDRIEELEKIFKKRIKELKKMNYKELIEICKQENIDYSKQENEGTIRKKLIDFYNEEIED